MRKIIQLDDYFDTGEPTVQSALLWHGGRAFKDANGGISKYASEATDFIQDIKPKPGKTIILVLALGGEETYGPNRNGDGFPARPVLAKKGEGFWVAPGEELIHHYRTFENGGIYKHHQNKDPSKSSGRVLKAFWNEKMQRVELLLEIDNNKDPEWVQRVNDGDFVAVSMGCKIKYDMCACCGNKAPTRAQYCNHIKYNLNQINPDGTRNYVHNPSPNFFDISRVFRPADKTGYTLKKVAYAVPEISSAELGERVDALASKISALSKLSDMDKIIRGETVASSSLSNGEQRVIRKFKDYVNPEDCKCASVPVEELIKTHPAEALSTLSSLGIIPVTRDFIKTMVCWMGESVTDDEIDKMVALQGHVFDLLKEAPSLLDEMVSTGILDESTTKISEDLSKKLEPLAKNAGLMGTIARGTIPEGIGIRPFEAATTDMLTHVDPKTNIPYVTQRGAAIDAHDMRAREQAMRVLAAGGLLAGGYAAMRAHPTLRPYSIPAALGAGYLGYKLWPRSKYKQTEQGIPISNWTELTPMQERTASFVVNRVRDYAIIPQNLLKIANTLRPFDGLRKLAAMDNINGLQIKFDDAVNSLASTIQFGFSTNTNYHSQ